MVTSSGIDLGGDRGGRPLQKIRWGQIWGTANFFSSPQTVDQVYATGYRTLRYFVTLRGAVVISRRGAVFRDAVRAVCAVRFFVTPNDY